jgi:hypothetical protein
MVIGRVSRRSWGPGRSKRRRGGGSGRTRTSIRRRINGRGSRERTTKIVTRTTNKDNQNK